LRRNFLLRRIIEGNIKGEIGVTGRLRKLLDELKKRERILISEVGSSKSHYVESSLWKRP
jgi:hypothetical protein